VNGDPGPLIERAIGRPRNCDSAIDTLYDARRYPDMYTTAHQYTDHVFVGSLQSRASEFYLGGYCKRSKYNPRHAVSWEGFSTEYGAPVLKNRRTALKVAVYSFASEPMEGVMRIWWLEHGRYRVSMGLDSNGDFGADGSVETSERADPRRLSRHPTPAESHDSR